MENLTSRRVSLLKEVKEKVGFRNSWSLDDKIVALFKGKKHIIASRKDLSKLGQTLVLLISFVGWRIVN